MIIAQITDIHWRGTTRHDEYTTAFEMLYEKLIKIKPDIIYIGGDIFHTKTQGITPEVIDKLVWMFRSLVKIAPVHIILGNHDCNLANNDRQDIISPIIKAINSPNIFLYKESGVYPIPGHKANFCVFSCFDKEGWKNVYPEDDIINIALYHGSISGCQTDSDWVLSEGEQDITLFGEYDFGMFGDIHCSQTLQTKESITETVDEEKLAKYKLLYGEKNIDILEEIDE